MPKISEKKVTTSRNKPVVEVAQDAAGWHWRLWAGNGQPLAESVTPYADQKQVIAAVRAAQKALSTTELIVKANG